MASTEFELWAGRLLECAPRGPGWREAIEGIYPHLRHVVDSVCSGWGKRPPMERDDLAHEVLLRLEENPPTRLPRSSARATVAAWIKATAVRLLIDAYRRSERVVERPPERGESSRRTPEHESLVVRCDFLDELTRYLSEHYPQGARLLELMIREPGLTSKEQSERLGLSAANVDQIRSRLTKTWLVRFHERETSRG